MRGNQLASVLIGAALTYLLLGSTRASSSTTFQLTQPNAPSVSQGRIMYQGRLTDNAGTPINATVAMTFKLYDDAGALLYTATRAVTPQQGLFTVDIGGGTDPDLMADPSNILGKVASIGVAVGGDPEMQPHQQLGTVIGHGNTSIGVVGSSSNFWGVYGHSINAVGVMGRSDTDIAIYAQSSSKTRPALAVDGGGDDGSIAFRTAGGGIEVYQAGVDTKGPVFIHKATNSNICNWNNGKYTTVVNHPLTNNDPNAILIVTPNYGRLSIGVAPTRGTLGVEYIDTDVCGVGNRNKWAIYNTDILRTAGDPAGSTDIPVNSLYNVFVIKGLKP